MVKVGAGAVAESLTEDCPQKLEVTIPALHQDLADVFEKKGSWLPPNWPYDCPIDLHPGTEIPFGWIYALSAPELEDVHEYLKENLARGFIRPSTPPVSYHLCQK